MPFEEPYLLTNCFYHLFLCESVSSIDFFQYESSSDICNHITKFQWELFTDDELFQLLLF